MIQLVTGILSLIMVVGLSVFVTLEARAQKENEAFQQPYLKKAGMGMILFGIYFLIMYMAKNSK